MWVKKLSVKATGAKGVSIAFDKLILQPGCELILYNSDKNFIMGPIREKDCYNNKYSTDIIPGEIVNIELFDPSGKGNNELHISNIGYIFDKEMIDPSLNILKSAEALNCEVNVACPEGDDYLLERDGVARIYVPDGSNYYYGTGCLIGNAVYDFTPYILTVFHLTAYLFRSSETSHLQM